MGTREYIYEKVLASERINFEEALILYKSDDLLKLGDLARKIKERKSGKQVFFNVNRHINLTNICKARCSLCAFAVGSSDQKAYLLDKSNVIEMVEEAKAAGVTEIHMVSALHPAQPFEYYVDVVQAVKDIMPGVHLKAFTPVEIVHFSQISGLSVKDVLERLKAAGLDSLPGGGAEILDDEIRRKICPNKASSSQWVEVIKTAHGLGIPTNATMLYGHIETIEQRIRHLFTLREIQDETGGFQAFVSFPFHPANTGLANLTRVSSWEDLKMISLARIILDNFDHIKAFWMMLTLSVAQVSLAFGVDDLDGTVVEEKIIHAAGAKTKTGITKQEIIALIRETGYVPVERDTFYRPLKIYNGDNHE